MHYTALRTLETPRLTLRRLRESDLSEYHLLCGSTAVCRYMLFVPHGSLDESRESLNRVLSFYEAPDFYRWAIARKEDDRLIGVISLLRFDETQSSCSFAYMLRPDCWNQGFGTESLKAVFRFAFGEMGIDRITADHMAANPASGAVMRKAGMTRTGILPGQYRKDGETHDAVCYEIRKEDFHDGQ